MRTETQSSDQHCKDSTLCSFKYFWWITVQQRESIMGLITAIQGKAECKGPQARKGLSLPVGKHSGPTRRLVRSPTLGVLWHLYNKLLPWRIQLVLPYQALQRFWQRPIRTCPQARTASSARRVAWCKGAPQMPQNAVKCVTAHLQVSNNYSQLCFEGNRPQGLDFPMLRPDQECQDFLL